ncbi:MAG: ATP-binding protein [Candidatus Micrarchaeota archaeon]
MSLLTKDIILEVLYEWNDWKKETKTGIKRNSYLNQIKRKISVGEVLIVKGVRRCGKSTITKQFVEEKGNPKNTLVINFEDTRLSNITHEDLARIYEIYQSEIQPKSKPLIVLDEVQNVKNWEKFVRHFHEKGKADIIVTGSSSKLLSGEYSTLLTGRHLDLTMFPLSFYEFLSFKGLIINSKKHMLENKSKIAKLLREYLEFGGFPKPTLIKELDLSKELLRSYYSDILHKDIEMRHSISESKKLDELARYYFTNNARKMSFNKAKNIVKLSLDSVERFSSYMEDAYLLFFVPLFSYSKKVQTVNPRKVYPVDTGLRNTVCFRFSKDFGWNAESAVFLQLKRGGYEAFYYSDSKGECDLIAAKEDEKIAIQVSWELTDKKREIQGLILGMKKINANEGWLITEDLEEDVKIDACTVHILPLWKWLLKSELQYSRTFQKK